jgi:hypothetical protein
MLPVMCSRLRFVATNILFVALGVTSCVQPSVRPIVGPDGTATLFVSCSDSGECYELAGKSCPQGYNIQRARGATPESYLVRCRTSAVATAAPPPFAYGPQPAQYGTPTQSTPASAGAWPPRDASVDSPRPWVQEQAVAPPPPPTTGDDYGQANNYTNELSVPRPIGSGEPDVGY